MDKIKSILFYLVSTIVLVILLILSLVLSAIAAIVMIVVIATNRPVRTIYIGDDFLTPTVRLSGRKLEFVFFNVVFRLFDKED